MMGERVNPDFANAQRGGHPDMGAQITLPKIKIKKPPVMFLGGPQVARPMT